MDHYESVLNASSYGTTLPKGPPAGFDPDSDKYGQWHPPHGDKPKHPADSDFTQEALAAPDEEVKSVIEKMHREGHAVSRHGPDVTDGQLEDRAMHSIDPITQTRRDGVNDGNHPGTATATQFTSDRALVHAYKSVENNTDLQEKIGTAKEHNKANPADPEDYVTFGDLSLESVFGPNYEKHVRGRTRTGTKNNPTGHSETVMTGYKIKAVYKLDRSTGEYHLHTMYPYKP